MYFNFVVKCFFVDFEYVIKILFFFLFCLGKNYVLEVVDIFKILVFVIEIGIYLKNVFYLIFYNY